MRGATALLLISLAACGRPEANGAGPACPHDPSFDRSGIVTVAAFPPAASLRHDLDLAALARESSGTVGAGRLQGLTEVEHRLGLRTTVSLAPSRGRACVWFDAVRIDMTPASVQIFVPKEYPEGSCEYDAVLVHEREHERIHRERLAAAAAEMRSALTAAKWLPGKGNPIEAADKESAEAALNDKISKVVHPAYEKFKADLTAAQAELDTPALYRWVTARCQHWK